MTEVVYKDWDFENNRESAVLMEVRDLGLGQNWVHFTDVNDKTGTRITIPRSNLYKVIGK